MPNDLSYLNTLNDKQREAVQCISGPLLILAGAGAGKTKTLTHRIYHLIQSGVHPQSILAITFTNKAAAELRERIAHLFDSEKQDDLSSAQALPLAKTFHSLSVMILREQHEKIGLPRFFTIFDRNDSLKAIKEALKIVNPPIEIKPQQALGFISSKKSEGISLEEIGVEGNTNFRIKPLVDIWQQYEKLLAKENALDFDDLLVKTVELLEGNDSVRDYYRSRWSHLHIDEYQDTNGIQYRLSKLLVGLDEHICVVGDADQTIYMWRGANIHNILNFEKDFKNSTTILLEQNYRSTKNILQAANDCIRRNTMRKEKNLFTDNEEGELISVRTYVTEEDEAESVAAMIEQLIEQGADSKEIGILYRANYQSRTLEEALMRHGIAYDLIGTKFFDRREVKDIMSYIRAAFNRQSITDISRAAGFPKRGLGPSTIEKMASGEIESLSPAARSKAIDFMRFLDEIKACAETDTPRSVLNLIIERANIERELSKSGEEGEERMENIRELVSLAASWDMTPGVEGIEQLLESASLTAAIDENGHAAGGVRLMTVHAAKGLEFKHVFITGLEEGLFPQKKEHTSKAEGEEERRLFYVALTRARQKLHLSYALSRRIFGTRMYSPPSEFVMEIDPSLVDSDQPVARHSPRRGGYLDDIDF